MGTQPLATRFSNIKIGKLTYGHALNKPILLLLALARCFQGKSRLVEFAIYEELAMPISQILKKKINICYPFGRLVNDQIWEIQSDIPLSVTNSGDLYRSELIANRIKGGFIDNIYRQLINNKSLILNISSRLLHEHFPIEQHAALRAAVGLPESTAGQEVRDLRAEYHQTKSDLPPKEPVLTNKRNGFIAYLNSLHNIGPGGANALAETQALNRYFPPLYEPFSVVETVVTALRDGTHRVVVLTGHAGDGKSTVALDVLKRLHGWPVTEPLTQALQEREIIDTGNGPITIVKDMSELSAQTRLQWLTEAFYQPGSWLVISNTGPLLNSLCEFGKPSMSSHEIEDRLLALLAASYSGGNLADHTFVGFPKELVIINLTQLDNVDLGTRVLRKMLNHPAWSECVGCPVEAACPLQLNRKALQAIGAQLEDRVRWVYQRLTHYEQRLTLRQMVAHLALSLTGGISCEEAQNLVRDSTAKGAEKGFEGLAQILFSETFFGYRNGKSWELATRLQAVRLARRLEAGGPVSVDYERQIVGRDGLEWAELPEILRPLWQRWRKDATNHIGVERRSAVRRLLYFFAKPAPSTTCPNTFLDTFLRSPRLRDFDEWQRAEKFTLTAAQQRKLRNACLRVLLECYSGFSACQFDTQDRLYLTLRRADRAVPQPTQWVMAALPFDDFELYFNSDLRMPAIRYRPYPTIELRLYLPLLDYIHTRDNGELGEELSRIHWAQLDAFRAQLLETQKANNHEDDITLLRVGIDGHIHLHYYVLDRMHNTLEIV